MRRLLPDTSRRRLLVAVQHASFSTTDKGVTITLNQRSRGLTGDPDKGTLEDGSWEKMATSRANLRAIGWGEGDFRKPIVTVASPYPPGCTASSAAGSSISHSRTRSEACQRIHASERSA